MWRLKKSALFPGYPGGFYWLVRVRLVGFWASKCATGKGARSGVKPGKSSGKGIGNCGRDGEHIWCHRLVQDAFE